MSKTKAQRARGEGYEPAPGLPKIKRTRGRPSEYDAVFLPEACALARQGATDPEIAAAMGVHLSTLYRWFQAYPELREAVKAAKETIDDRVERSLLSRATGYTQPVEKVFANGYRATVLEHIPADVAASFIWLKNRKRLDWRDRHETEIVIPVGDADPAALDARQLALAALALMSEAAYDPSTPQLEGSANTSEENDDARHADDRGPAGPRDPDFDDFDPGEL